ncbi:MAG: penicillin-binding protein 2 [Candidatus Wildermuthbacteria bacterium]|nr:penicillin-binding protein 2 [Candidatus Wildermuthbacteria bacterium]
MNQWRMIAVFFFLFAFGVGIVARLAQLQIFNYGFYKALAQGQHNFTATDTGERGTIYATDKDGALYPLATNRRVAFAFATPPEIQDVEATATELSRVLSLPVQEVAEKLRAKETLYRALKEEITSEEEEELSRLALPGIYTRSKSVRWYPERTMAAHLVGFVNKDNEGQYGVEEYYNDSLKGREGLMKNTKNPAIYLLFGQADTAQDGSDIVLTIDRNIQAEAERLLAKAKDSLGIAQGNIIVMEPATGNILAMANLPSFDPNAYGKVANVGTFQNGSVQKIFEPGSIFKPITMASALDTGGITPETTYTDTGIIKINNSKIYNYGQRSYGEQTMKDVLAFSINTGAVFAERQAGHESFLAYLERFGLFEPTRIDLPGEARSPNEELKRGREINYATASFGQGVEATPIQMIRAFSAFANNGVLASPTIRSADNSAKAAQTPILSEKTVGNIVEMLVGVVEKGFGKAAKIDGYYTAGKTGTAQVAWSSLGKDKAGYSDETIQSFIGFAPAYNPRFLMMVKLDNPPTKTAEYSAIPVFRELQKYILDYYQVPPDYDPTRPVAP